MAKRDVTLPMDDWQNVVLGTLANSAVPKGRAFGPWAQRFSLWQCIKESVQAAETDPWTVALTGRQCLEVIGLLQDPPNPWRLEVTERIWRAMEAFGWQRPDLDLFDDDDEHEPHMITMGPAIPIEEA